MKSALFILASMGLASAGSAIAQDYGVVDLGRQQVGIGVHLVDLNAENLVVGTHLPDRINFEASLWRDGTRVALSTPGGSFSFGAAVNELGQAAGVFGAPGRRPFVWADGKSRELDPQWGPLLSNVVSLNDRGHVFGDYEVAPGWHRLWLWRGASIVDLGGISPLNTRAVDMNARDDLVANFELGPSQWQSQVWLQGTWRGLGHLGGQSAQARAINDLGQVVGQSDTLTRETHAFLWTRGALVDIHPRQATWSEALDVNRRGEVVGQALFGSDWRAFLYFDGEARDLNRLLHRSFKHWTLTRAKAINVRGDIVAEGHPTGRPDELHELLLERSLRIEAVLPAVAGFTNIVRFSRATPGSLVVVLSGPKAGRERAPGCRNLWLGMRQPITPIGAKRANSRGSGGVSFLVPASLSGRRWILQAWSPNECRVGFPERQTFQ